MDSEFLMCKFAYNLAWVNMNSVRFTTCTLSGRCWRNFKSSSDINNLVIITYIIHIILSYYSYFWQFTTFLLLACTRTVNQHFLDFQPGFRSMIILYSVCFKLLNYISHFSGQLTDNWRMLYKNVVQLILLM